MSIYPLCAKIIIVLYMKKWEKFAHISQNISKNNQYFYKIPFSFKNSDQSLLILIKTSQN